MRVECIKDVVVSGRTVYIAGKEYDCEVKYDQAGNIVSHDITGECGLGVFMKGDPSLTEFFILEEVKAEALVEEKPQKKGILSFFNRKKR